MNIETYLAVGELVQAAAHLHGVTGPVMFTVCRPTEPEWCNNCGDCDLCEPDEDCEYCGEWERCTCFDDDTDEPDDYATEIEDFFYAQSFC